MLGKKSQKLKRKPSKVHLFENTNKAPASRQTKASAARLSPMFTELTSPTSETFKVKASTRRLCKSPLKVKMLKVYRAYVRQQSLERSDGSALETQLQKLKLKNEQLRDKAGFGTHLQQELSRVVQENNALRRVASQSLEAAMLDFQRIMVAVVTKLSSR